MERSILVYYRTCGYGTRTLVNFIIISCGMLPLGRVGRGIVIIGLVKLGGWTKEREDVREREREREREGERERERRKSYQLSAFHPKLLMM